jgi:hypothetical protein
VVWEKEFERGSRETESSGGMLHTSEMQGVNDESCHLKSRTGGFKIPQEEVLSCCFRILCLLPKSVILRLSQTTFSLCAPQNG